MKDSISDYVLSEKEFSKKEVISSSSNNKNSMKGMESSSKNILTEEPKD